MARLPLRTIEIIGRAKEIAEVGALLRERRLLTLLGPPGSGKTTLALECARQQEPSFPGGASLVDLASAPTPDAFLPTLASAIGTGSAPDVLGAITARLCGPPTLLVLDNCEHLVEDVARACASWLAGSASVTILATSRRALSVAGEALYHVEPLAVGGSPDDPDLESPAVQLFVRLVSDRGGAERWNRDQLQAAWSICARLDGLPLAIELAAARCTVLTPRQLLEQLGDGVPSLASERRDVSERHRSLDASIEWSWKFLDPASANLLARLSVFPGDFSFESAVAVSAETPDVTLAGLGELVDSSLLRVISGGSESRYRLLDSIRAYSGRRLEASGMSGETQDRVLTWCLEFVDRLSRDPSSEVVIGRLADELPTIRVAIDHAVASGTPASAARLAVASYRLWETRQVREGISIAERLLDSPLPWRERGDVLLFGARLASLAGDVDRAAAWAAEAADIGRSQRDAHGTAAALRVLARATRWVGEPHRALALYEEAIALLDVSGGVTELIDCYTGVADLATWMGDVARADAASATAVELARAMGDGPHLVRALTYSAAVDHAHGRVAEAIAALDEAAKIADLLGEQVFAGLARGWKARMGAYHGTFEESLSQAQAVKDASLRSNLLFVRMAGEWATAHLLHDSDPDQVEIARVEETATTLASIQFPSFAAELLAVAASVKLTRGDIDGAAALVARAYEHARLPHGRFALGRVMLVDALLAAARRRSGDALNTLYDALGVMGQCGDRLGQLDGVEEAARLVAARTSALALQLLAVVAQERARLGIVSPPVRSSTLAAVARRAAEAIGPEAAAAARDAAGSLSLDDAIALLRRRRGRPRAATWGWSSLTPSEIAVAREIAGGRTTNEIAARLSVSPTTVKTHVKHIFDKLGVRTRAAVAAVTAQLDGSVE